MREANFIIICANTLLVKKNHFHCMSYKLQWGKQILLSFELTLCWLQKSPSLYLISLFSSLFINYFIILIFRPSCISQKKEKENTTCFNWLVVLLSPQTPSLLVGLDFYTIININFKNMKIKTKSVLFKSRPLFFFFFPSLKTFNFIIFWLFTNYLWGTSLINNILRRKKKNPFSINVRIFIEWIHWVPFPSFNRQWESVILV